MNRPLGLAIKRLIDVLVSALGLAALAPLGALLVGLELVFHGWPPFFTQARVGLGERVFRMVKLRSMTNERGPDGELLPDHRRLTRFGRFLRASSLDELPELWNVLKGDMSLVGPRPLLVPYLPHYTEREATRHHMRPGITGLAQINGRNAISWDEKLEWDARYVEKWSLWLDFQVLLRTVSVVLGREDIDASAGVTMPRFDHHRMNSRPA